jgi:dihydroneopterin aldolase
VTIELMGLVVFGHHGYLEEERRLGQRFLVDLWVDVRGEATESDRIEDTVDYRRIAALVRDVFAGEERLLLEGLAGSIADGILERFAAVDRARVRVR